MPELTAFQDAFDAALQGEARSLGDWTGPGAMAGLSVYRNTVAKGSVDALEATFPTVVKLVGEGWFRAAAIDFIRDHPPSRPSLLAYGVEFDSWLAAFPPAQDADYLPHVARMDWLWQEAYFAGDAVPLQPGAFAGLGPRDFAATTVTLHPSVRLAAFDRNIVSLWLAHRGPEGLESFELTSSGEQALVARPELAVEVRLIDGATHAFLAACAAGDSLLSAAERACAADPAADLAAIVATTLEAGVFAALTQNREAIEHVRLR